MVITTAGHAQLNGSLDNTSATLTAPAGGPWELFGGTITGGSIAGGALVFTSSGGRVDAGTLLGDVTLGAGTYVYFSSGTTFTGNNITFGSSSGLYWQQIGTFGGKTLAMNSGSYVYVTGVNNAFTFDAASTANGSVQFYSDGNSGTAITNLGTINHTSGTGQLYARMLTNSGAITATAGTLYIGYPGSGYDSLNTGTITANGSGTIVYLRGNFDNDGSLDATNAGILRFDGSNVTANLGTINLSTGGHAQLNGTLDNTAATLNALIGGTFELLGGTILNGTIAPGALTFTGSGGTLNNVLVNGDLVFGASTYAFLTGGTAFTGANGTMGNNSGIYWQQAGTLVGKAINQGSGAYWYLSGTNAALTIDPASSFTGTVNIYSDGSTGTSVTNQGTITHLSGSGNLYARNFNNFGTISINGGSVNLGNSSYALSNAAGASIVVNGGTAYLYSPLTNAGTVKVQSGTFYSNGNLTNGSGGLITGAGTINGNLTMAGGVLAPGNSVGTLTLSNSAFAVTAASTLEIEISGATSDRLLFQSPSTNVDLGSGLLALSLSLLSAPTTGTTYSIVSIASGTKVVTGTFAGLPTSGSSLIASFGAQDYTFTVNYLSNGVTLNFVPVPEPGTYALLAGGVALLGLRRRTRTALWGALRPRR